MILRSLALLIFLFLSVVLYYQNIKLSKQNDQLQEKLNQKKPQKTTIKVQTEVVFSENNETEVLRKELESCKQKLNLKTIENLVPQNKPDLKKENYQRIDNFHNIKPIYNDKNESKKDFLKVRPDFDYDKKTQDMSLRLEVQKNF